MTDKRTQAESGQSNTEKDPDDWVTGDEPMTGAQRSYLTTLSQEAKVEVDTNLTKAEASRRIDELQKMTGRGTGASQGDGEAGGERGQASTGSGSGSADERGGTGQASGAGGGGSKSNDAGNSPPGGGAGDDAGATTNELDFDGNGSRSRS